MLKHLWKVGVVAAVGAIAAASASTITGTVAQPTLAESRITLNGCSAASGGAVTTSFKLNEADTGVGGPRNQIQSVTFNGLGPDCAGKYAHIALVGNSTGDPSLPGNFSELGATSGGFATSGAIDNCVNTSTNPWSPLHPQVGTDGQITALGAVTVNFCVARGLPEVAHLTGINLVVSDNPGF
jgi:hypothetical protein